jgi:hypothetical protein
MDRGVSIPNCPIGCDFEIGDDYSMGKFEEVYGEEYEQFLQDRSGNSISSNDVLF